MTAVINRCGCLHFDTVQFLSIALNSATPTSDTTNTSYGTLTESFHIAPLCPLSHPSYLSAPSSASLSPTSRSVLFLSGTPPNHAPSTDSAAPSTNPDHPPTSILIHSRSRMCRLCEDRNTKWTLQLCGWSVGGMVAISIVENLTNEEGERLKVLLIDDTNQKAYFAFQDI